ncbi:MAG: carbonic anhydrase family protein [Pseudonocardiaceae bacterium]
MIETALGRRVGRRTTIFGIGCAAMAMAFPSSADAHGSTTPPNHSASASRSAQSPIDFHEKEITFVSHLPKIGFSYPQTDVTLVNTGSPDEFATVRADVPPGAACIILNAVRHDLVQFHWHTPSEHRIEGRQTPLEMHFVHRQASGSLLVIGVFIERGRTNSAIDPIFRKLPDQPGATRDVAGVHLGELLPAGRESFRYWGSLTVPPFTEGVQFVVFTDSIHLAARQISAFRELFGKRNSREVQSLNGRKILSNAHAG